jgi:hypothetical protein
MANTDTAHRNAYSYDNSRTDWRAAVWAGIIAGLVFMMLEMAMVMIFMNQSPWGPPRMIAAMLLGKEVLPPPADFDAGIMMTAMLIHFPLSIILGLVAGWIVHRLGSMSAVIVGGLFGLVIYFINFYLVAPAFFPWFTQAQNWVSLTAHLVYGLVLGGVYAGLRKAKPSAQR